MILNSYGVTRTRSVSALALPLGSAGRPTLLGLGWAGISILLYKCCLHCGLWRDRRGNMQHSHITARMPWIVRLMRPGIGSVCLGVALEVEDLNYPVPNGLTFPSLFYGDAFPIDGYPAVELLNHVP
jgi:hypothetical protein